ncbi:MAG: hypothetical protein N2447_09755 [Thermoanaerobaculum sp.]|nr:hypothetical protein [Thermoanaerobaculum sp.]
MRRVEPTYPDLFPLTHQLGSVPLGPSGVSLDLVGMRLLRQPLPGADGDTYVPKRPVRVLVYGAVAKSRRRAVERLMEGGCGLLVVADEPLLPEDLPSPFVSDQLTVVNLWVPSFWGPLPTQALHPFREAGFPVGTVVALAPQVPIQECMAEGLATARSSGAQFVVLAPLSLSGEERHFAYDRAFGEEGNSHFEDLLFHSDPVDVARTLEVNASAIAATMGLREGLPGPSTALCKASCFAAAASLLVWARRLDLMDGVASSGWRLRRAAQALLVAGRDPAELMEEDNLRLVPGFDAWVEAFARSLWARSGEPFASLWMRWLSGARGG